MDDKTLFAYSLLAKIDAIQKYIKLIRISCGMIITDDNIRLAIDSQFQIIIDDIDYALKDGGSKLLKIDSNSSG